MQQFERGVTERFRPEVPSVGWSWRLIVFSTIVAIAAVLLYAGMEYGYRSVLESERNSLEQELAQVDMSINAADQNNLINFYSQIYNMQNLLRDHITISNLFSFLEPNTNSKVQYTQLNMNLDSYSIDISGTAPSMDAIVNHLDAFRRQPMVAGLVLRKADSNQGGDGGTLNLAPENQTPASGFNFTINLTLSRDFFKQL